ncbi:MAG: GNAT family N-acetyltransferase [Leptolyngbyaceae cyanobacterium MO_188.B28]|nr:GNAT family N-acetyltransferase [Leptolyngbyaceae cyanobacterium MO_188.B28]
MVKRSYSFKLALLETEVSDYFGLRKQIFCDEQGLFEKNDQDALDNVAYPIVAVVHTPEQADHVVGVVRIYEKQPGLWYGGRLGVHPDFRRMGRIGKGLIQKAVTTANAWGCDRFLATVQLQNVQFFTRLHWNSLEEIEILGRPHHLMEADLEFYPAADQRRPSLPLLPVPLQSTARVA